MFFFFFYLKTMHVSHTRVNSQEINSKNHPEPLILHIIHKRPNVQIFFYFIPYIIKQFVWFMLFHVNTHFSLHLLIQLLPKMYSIDTKPNCAFVSKWIPNLIWQVCYKLPKICFFYTLFRANEKAAQTRYFTLRSLVYNILNNSLSIW